MALPNPSMSFSPFAILTAEEMNDLVENIESLASGTGFNAGAISTAAIADGAVTTAKLGLTPQSWTPTITPQGAMTYTGVSTTAWYVDFGGFYQIWVYTNGTTGGTPTIGFNVTNLPFAVVNVEQTLSAIADVGANDSGYAHNISSTEIAIRRPGNVAWNAGAGRGFVLSGMLRKL